MSLEAGALLPDWDCDWEWASSRGDSSGVSVGAETDSSMTEDGARGSFCINSCVDQRGLQRRGMNIEFGRWVGARREGDGQP